MSPPKLSIPITELGLNKRALHACEALGIETVADALECDFERFSAIPNCGRRTWDKFIARVRSAAGRPEVRRNGITTLLPSELADMPVDRLLLPDSAYRAMESAGITTVGQIFAGTHRLLGSTSPADIEALRAEIGRLVRNGTDRFLDGDRGDAFRALLERLLTCCKDANERHLFERRVGIGRRAERRWHLAAKWRVAEGELASREQEIVDRMRARYAALLARFAEETRSELAISEGVLTGSSLAPGTLLHSAAASLGDSSLPLRLAAVLFPKDFFFHGTFLSTMPPEELDEVVLALRRLVRRSDLPRPVVEIRGVLAQASYSATSELVAHLSRTRLNRSIEIDPVRGEVVAVRSSTITQRLQILIEECDGPVELDELLFAYRERHRRCKRNALLDNLRGDGRFLEVERDLWSLRERHLDELEFARLEAQRVSHLICTTGGRHSVHSFAERNGYAERQRYLVVDTLRKDPNLRDLGRQEFCPRHQRYSRVMGELMRAMRRAAGEIPAERFLTNQEPKRRRLVEVLLRRNRMFISPTQDRVDLLVNYPFDTGRLRRSLIIAEQCLELHGGYATIARVRDALEDDGLGGSFLTEHLVEDLLARHGTYEFLPGGIVAKASLGLTGWIHQRIRETIRGAGEPLTPSQLLMERPELAEFVDSLAELMACDPLLQSHDGQRYEVA